MPERGTHETPFHSVASLPDPPKPGIPTGTLEPFRLARRVPGDPRGRIRQWRGEFHSRAQGAGGL